MNTQSPSPGPTPDGRAAADADKAAAGISQFLGRVLDQLNASAWLPATMLVGNAAILIQLRSQGNLDVGKAVVELTRSPLGILVVLLLGLIIATMLTQAFQFEAIRLLEGYWRSGTIRSRIADSRIRHYSRLQERISAQYNEALSAAFRSALQSAALKEVPIDDIVSMRAIIHDSKSSADEVAMNMENADWGLLWTKHAPAEMVQKLDSLRRRRGDFPDPDRIMPTRLGNTLRAREDSLENVEGELEGFVIKNYNGLPEYLRAQHDQYRNRLDMYCSLVLIFVSLALLGFALLIAVKSVPAYTASMGAAVLYLALAAISYRAAITSARGYGALLVMIDEYLGETKRAQESRKFQRWRRLFRRNHPDSVSWAVRRRN